MKMNKGNSQRKLLIVPILHTREDMGSLGSRLPSGDGYSLMASSFWKEVREKVKERLNGLKKVKVYQDGLPDTQEKLVEKVINEVKSPNYKLLRSLKARGAKIFGTEDPKLLKEEYYFVSQIANHLRGFGREPFGSELRAELLSRIGGGIGEDKKKAAELLAKRDAYIAKRINKTLKEGEFGLLFLGAAHQIQDKLPKDIQIEIL